jgi:hypothetical protein
VYPHIGGMHPCICIFASPYIYLASALTPSMVTTKRAPQSSSINTFRSVGWVGSSATKAPPACRGAPNWMALLGWVVVSSGRVSCGAFMMARHPITMAAHLGSKPPQRLKQSRLGNCRESDGACGWRQRLFPPAPTLPRWSSVRQRAGRDVGLRPHGEWRPQLKPDCPVPDGSRVIPVSSVLAVAGYRKGGVPDT